LKPLKQYSRKAMITDVRAQVDLIGTLHLEALFKLRHLEGAAHQDNRAAHVETAILHSKEHDSVQLRHRLALIRGLALLAQGLTIETDMAQIARKSSS
jgi:hypothetical protein